jgi:hypothetical protein
VLPGESGLASGPAPVHRKDNSGDRACKRAGEKEYRVGDLLRLQEAAERDSALGRLDEGLILQKGGGHWSNSEAGSNAIDPHTGFSPIDRKRAGERGNSTFARYIGPLAKEARRALPVRTR